MDPHKPSSSGAGRKWLIGCGIGCGVVIVIAALLVVGGVLYFRNLVEGFKDSEVLLETLTERYGRVTEYTPSPDGIIKPDRIEAFLAAREATSAIRNELARSINILSDEDWEGEIDVGAGNVFQKIKLGFGLIPQMADFFKSRNQALLDVEMGMGEYYYLYTLIYYSWLGKPLMDGPPIRISGRGGGPTFQGQESEESREVQQDLALRRLHRMILPMLHNQRQQLDSRETTPAEAKWREILSKEIDAMEADRYRMVWQDGLPERIANAFEPYRQRLEDSYSAVLNSLEIYLEQR